MIFSDLDAGNTNVVDTNFEIASLHYTGEGGHVTDLAGGTTLQVDGGVSIGSANPNDTGTLIISGATAVTANVTELNIGMESSGSDVTKGSLLLTDTASLTAIVGAMSIGRVSSSSGSGIADGSLILGSNSLLNVGTSVARANLTLGFNESSMGTSGATGILDALESAATVNLHLDELNIGRSLRGQTSTGILRWNQSEVIEATTIYLSRGSGAVGQIETPSGGTLLLGTATEQVSNLRIGWNASQVAGAASGTLDLAAANPIFEAHIGSDLTLGRTTGGASFGANPGQCGRHADSGQQLDAERGHVGGAGQPDVGLQ